MMMLRFKEETSQSSSSMFGAPTEHVVDCGESQADACPSFPTCPKVEGNNLHYYSAFCFCVKCKIKRADFMKTINDLERTWVPDTDNPVEDEIKIDCIFNYVQLWPQRYFERFQKWYVRRCEKFSYVKDRSFKLWAVVNYKDVFHHLKNWDNGLRKSLIQDQELKKNTKVIKRIKMKQRKFKKPKENGKHPHMGEQLQDKEIGKLGYKFKNQAVIDPKTSQVKYLEVGDKFIEQGDSGITVPNLEETSSVIQTSNITFVDERPIDTTSLHTSGEVFSQDVHKDIAESDWTLNKILTREYPIATYTWSTANEKFKDIVWWGVPKIITDQDNCMITQQLRFFAFLRSGVKIRFQLNGTKFHLGRLVVWFRPLTWNDDVEVNEYTITNWPHFFLDASVSNSGEIFIPFTHLLSHFSQENNTLSDNSLNSLGSLHLTVFNKLQPGDGASQNLTGQVYASLIDPHVHLPTTRIETFSYGIGYMQGLESVLKKAAGSAINSGLGLADKFTGGLVTGAGDAICNLLGIRDKPTDPVSASPIVNRTVSPLCHGAGLDRSVRLGLSPISQTNTKPSDLGAFDGDYDIKTLCQMPSLLDQPEWNDTQQSGTKIFDMLVTPVYLSNPQYTADGEANLVNYKPTMLAYVSRAFCLWRGSLRVKVQIVATAFHSGRLALVFDPHGTTKFNKTDFESNKNHNVVIMDIEEQQELVVELPYFAVRPWLRCDKFKSDANLVAKSTVDNPSYLDNDICGVFRIFVLNTLVKPPALPSKVDINVFVYASDNFELSVPNTVAPLSVRKGPSGVQYDNTPRYPWCKKGSDNLCYYVNQILDLYAVGQKLVLRQEITPGASWLLTTSKLVTSDSIVFLQQCKNLKYAVDTKQISDNCITFINALPNYEAPTLKETLENIESSTQHVQGKVDDPIVPILEQTSSSLSILHSKSDDIDKRVKQIQEDTSVLAPIVSKIDAMRNVVNATHTDVKLVKVDNKEIKQDLVENNALLQEVDAGVKSLDVKVLQTGVHYDRYEGEYVQDTDTYYKLHEQAGNPESYTTTRESDGAVITITDGNLTAKVAPETTSENAMNLQTLLRRYWPLYVSPIIENVNRFTVITVPVSPSFIPDDSDTNIVSSINRRFEANNLAWFARLFTYWRGSMRYKILFNSGDAEIFVWHNPVDTKKFTVVSGFKADHLVEQMNFATEVAITRVQQAIEVEVPFYSGFNQLMHSHVSNKTDLRAINGILYVAIRPLSKKFSASIFVSTGDDFMFNVLRAPPTIHEPEAAGYVDAVSEESKYPELQKSTQNTSTALQIPGTQLFDRWKEGHFVNCDIPDFSLEKLPKNRQQKYIEQMTKIVHDMTGVSEIKNIYYDDVKPKLDYAREKVDLFSKFVDEFNSFTLPRMMGEMNAMKNEFQHLNATVDEFKPKVDELKDSLETCLAKHGAAADFVASMGAHVGDMAKAFEPCAHLSTFFLRMILYNTLFNNLIAVYKKFSWLSLFNIVTTSCVLFQINPINIMQWLMNMAHKFYEDCRSKATNGAPSRYTEQGFDDFIEANAEECGLVLSALATVIYCALFGYLPTLETVKEAIRKVPFKQQGLTESLKNMHFSTLGFKAINQSFHFFNEWITKLIDWYLERDAKEVILKKQFDEKAEEILAWIEEIEALEDEDFYHQALQDVNTHNRYYKLVDKSKEFEKWILTTSVSQNVSKIISEARRRLMDMIKRINRIRPGHGFRYAPFTVYLYGESGIGKSNVMHKFTDIIREELGVPYYHSKFAVPNTEKFLDGYEGQSILEWDDMLQCPEQDKMVADFIQWRSNADCIVDKAHVEEKGMHFVSKAIIATSNINENKFNTIRDMAAFRNRWNLRFKCKLAPDYSIEDIRNLPPDPNFSFLLFDAERPAEGGKRYETIGANLTYERVIDMTRTHFASWDRKQNMLISDYFAEHGSLQIPKGVYMEEVIENSVQDVEVQTEWKYELTTEEKTDLNLNKERGFAVRFVPNKEQDELETELFQIQFEELDTADRLSLLRKIKLRMKPIQRKCKRVYEILREQLKRVWKTMKDKLLEFYEKHPTFVKALGILSMFTTTAMMIRFLWCNNPLAAAIEESAYQQETPKVKTKLIKAEGTYNTEINKIKPSLIKAEAGNYNVELNHCKTKLVKAEASVYQTEVPTRQPKLVKAEGKHKEEGTDDDQAVLMGRQRIHPLLYTIGWEQSEKQCILQALAIGGKVILTPYHFFRYAKDDDIFWFKRGNDKILVQFARDRLFQIKGKDAALYYMGPQFDSRKNIVNCFIKEECLSLLGNRTSAVLVGTLPNGGLMEKACDASRGAVEVYQDDADETPVWVQYGWNYNINTLDGECGSPLILLNKRLPPPAKIAGIHIAGTSVKGGFAVLVTQEQIVEVLVEMTKKHGKQVDGMSLPPQIEQDDDKFYQQCKVIPEGSFSYYGVMDPKFCPSQPMKSALKPTPWQGKIYDINKKPAMLKPFGNISPLKNALGKYGKLTKPFKLRHLKIVKEDILNELLQLDGDLKPEVVDERTAVFGIDGIDYCEKLNMNSSPGWPYQCLPGARGEKGKRYLFDEDKQIVKDPLLRRNIDLREEMAKKGERFPSVWRDCLKDELRPVEKVNAGKTRLFTIAPVDYTILVRKYFLAFEQAFYKNHNKFFSAVGINPESYEWTEAYNRLRKYGSNCAAGDFSCFDGTLMADIIFMIGEIIIEWYKMKGEDNIDAEIVRRVLFDEMIHTLQLVMNCAYKTHQGNPSGNPLTVIINTIANIIYMRLAWLEIMDELAPELSSMYYYHLYVMEEAYGDDNRLIIRKPILDRFNQATIAYCLAQHGIVYTDETKTGEVIPFRQLETTSFLKRAYNQIEEVGKEFMLPAIDKATITSLTNWYREGDDIEEQIQSNMKAALDFAFFHGREFYDDFKGKFAKVMREHGMKPVQISFEEQLNRFIALSRGDGKQKFCDLGF